MKRSILNTVAMAIAVLALVGSPAGAAERVAKPAPSVLPPYEILTIVRSAGLNPLGRPTRRGTNYQLRAVDEIGQPVTVVVDGRVGEVISVTPVALGPRDRMREYDSVRPSVYDSGVPLYEPGQPVYRAAPPIIIEDDSEPPPVYRRSVPVVPLPMVAPPRPERDAVIAPPPALPDTEIVARPTPPAMIPHPAPEFIPQPPPGIVSSPPPAASLPEPEGDDSGLLPPPPPRFPQRIAPTTNAKPAPKSSKTASNPPAAKPAATAKPVTAKPNTEKSTAAAPATTQSTPPAANAKPADIKPTPPPIQD